MSNEATATKQSKNARPTVGSQARPQRTATFRPELVKGVKIFRPVNKRAHKYAKLVGKRTRLTLTDIVAIQATGKVKVAVYLKDNTLKAVA